MALENEDLDMNEEVLDQDEPLGDDVEIIVDEDDEGEGGEEAEAGEEAAVEAAPEPEEEAAPADDDEDAGDAELTAMPDKIKKRFMREKRLRDEIINEREQIKDVALRVAQVAQQRETEVLQLKKAQAALQKQHADTLEFAYEQAIQIKSGELRKARDDGSYDDELKAQGELDKLRFQQNQIRESKRNLVDPESIQIPQPQAFQQPQQPARKPDAPEPLAVKWIDTNKVWFNNKSYAGHRAFVLAEDAKLVEEGYDKKSPAYYKELDRRIDQAFPTLRKRAAPKGAPVAGVSNTPAARTSSRTIKLNKADLRNMRMFGLDPSNKEHLREFARSKRTASV
jgi:hypothetical protein